MTREMLDRRQVWAYLAAVLLGLMTGAAAAELAPLFEALLWPALTLLLYATFTQVRMDQLPAALRDRRFMGAALIGNFVVLPVLAYSVLFLAPADPAIRLGLLLVLLVPCTDWFLTFAQQAGGDLKRAIALTPVLLIVQMLLLPIYLGVFLGEAFMQVVSPTRMLMVFVGIVMAPLALAWLTEQWADRRSERAVVTARIGWLPVPLLAAVLFMIAASQVETVLASPPMLGGALMACIAFLVGAVICALVIARIARLPVAPARTLLFSLSTRNSFVVLPFALALPAGWEMAAIVIVLQSLVELLGMVALLWLTPRGLLPTA